MIKDEDKKLFQDTIKESGTTILYLLPLYAFILLAKPSFPILLIAIFLFQWTLTIYFEKKDGIQPKAKRLLISAVTTFVFLYIIYYMSMLLGAWGFLGVLFIVFLLVARILYVRWNTYMRWVRHIEKRFFGLTAEERREQRRKTK